jgi:hypothetical protein
MNKLVFVILNPHSWWGPVVSVGFAIWLAAMPPAKWNKRGGVTRRRKWSVVGLLLAIAVVLVAVH